MKKFNTSNLQFILITYAMTASAIFSGALSAQMLILPGIFLAIAAFFGLRKIGYNMLFITAIIITGVISICTTFADRQNAVYEFFKIIIFTVAFSAGLSVSDSDVEKSVITVAAVTAFCGILAYCNIIRINEFIFNDRYFPRLQSVIKYANTTAVLLGCGYFACLRNNAKKYTPYIGTCILLALYLTISKAAIPIFIALETFLIIAEKQYSVKIIIQNVLTVFFAAAIVLLAKEHRYSIAFLMSALNIAIGGSIACNNISIKCPIFIWLAVLICGTAAIGIYACIGNTDIFITLVRRLEYIKDALQLLKHNWIAGIGPGGWKYYQYGIQTRGYSVTYLHSGWLQILLEYGIFGFSAFAAITIGSVINAIRRKNYILLSAIMLIATHSLIDIDFGFGIIMILYGLMLGCTAGAKARRINTGGIIYAVFCTIFILYMCSEFCVRLGFEKAYLNGDEKAALKNAYRLEKICPYDSKLKLSIAALDKDNAKDKIEDAAALSPLDANVYLTYINYMADNKYEININELCSQFLNLAPMQESTYTEAYKFLDKALKNGVCDYDEYLHAKEIVAEQQQQRNVVSRNDLLNTIIN